MRAALIFLLITVQTWAQLSTNAPTDLFSGRVTSPATLKDFTVVLDVPGELSAGSWIDLPDFKLSLAERRVRAEVSGVVMETSLSSGKQHVVVLVIKRDARQALSSLWIDGVEVRSAAVPPGATSILTIPEGVTIYDRTLTRPEVIERSQHHTEKTGWAVIGGSEAVAIMESGYLEAWWMPREPVRSLAWEGDTVFRQDRPLNFGTLEDQIKRLQPKGLMVMFGRQECLELGESGLADFSEAMKAWKVPAVIVGPVPFEKKQPPMRDLSALNPVLAKYNEALSKLPGAKFIDLFSAQVEGATRDGVTLTDKGCREYSRLIAAGLGTVVGQLDTQALQLVREKNRLWHNYWRPSNWAFLYGDRTAQPSSRDHLDPKVRWFPGELEEYRKLITAKEQALWNLSPAIP